MSRLSAKLILIISIQLISFQTIAADVATKEEILKMYNEYINVFGADDGISHELRTNPDKYAKNIIQMLLYPATDTLEEEAAFSFVEAVKGEPGVTTALCTYGKGLDDPKNKRLVMLILGNSPRLVPLESGNNQNRFRSYEAIRPERQENKCPNFSCCQ